jgi:RNA polymerase sigma factor (sigma-70 family)
MHRALCERQLDEALTIAVSAFVAHQRGIDPDDLDDLRQEVALAILPRLPEYDPARASWRTFVTGLAVRAMANAYRAWRNRRTRQREDSYAQCGECSALHGVSDLRGDHIDDQAPASYTDGTEHYYLGQVVRTVLMTLTPRQRAICEQFMHGQCVSAAARTLGLSRTYVYRELTAIGRVFVAAGLEVRHA